MERTQPEQLTGVPARWWHATEDGRIQCDLCPRNCRLHDGQRGACFVRGAQGGRMLLTTYGRSSGFCLDPIEKKPLNHFYPGSSVLSFGTAGCNLACKFCQNWEISKSRDMDRLMDSASPVDIARTAQSLGARSVAFTYNDPVIFAEYAMDTAEACHALGIHTVAVTAGYIHPEPARAFFAHMDAANIDLKGFSERFYHDLCAGRLAPVLETLRIVWHETSCWLEITNLLIPGHNDTDDEIRALAGWCAHELSPDVPLHLTAYHPDYKLSAQPTSPAALVRARQIALDAGLNHVYTGNIRDRSGGITHCSTCGSAVITRDGYTIVDYRLDASGHCQCGATMAGRFAEFHAPFGARRIPIHIGRGADGAT